MKAAVVGLGKVGLPLAAQYASRGIQVVGCDIDGVLVDRINAGDCPITGEEGLEAILRAAIESGKLRATTGTASAVAECDVVVLIVPVGLTPDNESDLAALKAATADVSRGLRSQTLVSVESTVPVGTTRKLAAMLGDKAMVVASPERVSSGRILRDLRTYPKLIGPMDDESWARAGEFYRAALEAPSLLRLRDPETAEFAKIAEGIYRDVNIGLANDLARYADRVGVDVTEAIDVANTQPYSHLHRPGVGVGGHCIPVYPHFIRETEGVELPRVGRRINDSMADYGVDKLERALGSLRHTKVLVLGLSYRPNVKEAANSSTFLLAEALRSRGARVQVHDPLYPHGELQALGLEPPASFPLPVDAVVLQALHDAYVGLDYASFGCRAVLDGRNVLDRAAIEAAGIRYVGIGR
jgi:nucleotide sugar dehydrogenase